MRIDRVEAENFLSHKDTTLEYPGERVQVDGANGSGKTSLTVDAPLWALFGQARGATTDSLKGPWNTQMSVAVEFVQNKKLYRVHRVRGSQSKLALLNKTDNVDMTEKHIQLTQAKVNALLGSYNAFVNTAIVRQGDALRFARATPAERNALFDELIGTEEFGAVEKGASAKKRGIQMQVDSLEMERRRLLEAKSQIETITTELVDRRAELEILEYQAKSHEDLAAAANEILDQLETHRKRLSQLQEDSRQAEIKKLRIEANLAAAQARLKNAQDRLVEYTGASTCPTCGQALDSDEEKAKLVKIRQIWQDNAKLAQDEINSYTRDLDEAEKALDEAQDLAGTADQSIADKYARAKTTKQQSENQLGDVRLKISAKEREVSGLEGKLSILSADTAKLADVDKELIEQRRRAEGFGVIAEAFSKRGIPRELKRSFVSEVEKGANSLLAGLAPFTVRISLDKDGVVRSGVTEGTVEVFVKDTAGERRVEMLSGGEQMRTMLSIRLATALTMAKKSDRGIRTLILDESLDGLDQPGKDAALGMIQALQPSFDRMVFITHDPSIAGLFPDRVALGKVSDGSSVVL